VKKIEIILLVITVCVLVGFKSEIRPTGDPVKSSLDKKIESILASMTLEDKVGEMTQLSIDVISKGDPYNLQKPHQLDSAKLHRVLVDLKVGSILNAGGYAYDRDQWKGIISSIQEKATKEKANGIPVLYGIDAIHGTNYTAGSTLFPQQLGTAATWNTEMARTVAEVTAYETRASGIPWTFSPVLDLGRDARWSRLWETFGEDVYLAKKMGVEMIKGYQGDDVSSPYHVAACLKHFLGYGYSITGKDRAPTWIPERQLREYYIPTFKAAIDAGAKTIMICSGEMNGIPVHANSKILIDLLRGELGFEGPTVSDWEDIGYLQSRHRVAANFKDAIAIAVNAGIDLAMVPMDTNYPNLLKELVEEGRVPESRIDEAVRRIIKLKMELDLFENPLVDFDQYKKFGSEEHRLKALASAEESIILLKNENNILPLNMQSKVFVTGPTADDLSALNGGWTGTWQGRDKEHLAKDKFTVLTAIQKTFGTNNVSYAPGVATDTLIDIPAAVEKAKMSDVILLCLGELSYTEKPGDIDDLNLPDAQLELVKALKDLNKPMVMLLLEGRPRIVREVESMADGIVLALLPGNEGAEALVNILTGKVNPSGKLPITYPKNVNDLVTYDHKGTDLAYRDHSMNGFHPQWEFGYGLSYTQFAYSAMTITGSLSANDLKVSVNVTNTGKIAGKEVIQLYVTDEVATITPSVKRLRGFEKTLLNAGETKTISFSVTKEDLAFVSVDNVWVTEKGTFEASIGDQKMKFKY